MRHRAIITDQPFLPTCAAVIAITSPSGIVE